MKQFGELVLIALGSNKKSSRGDPTETVCFAIDHIRKIASSSVFESRLFATPAFPVDSGPDFVNAAVALHSDLPASDLLAHLHQIEAEADRERRGRWTQRTLDLDLLAVGNQVYPNEKIHSYWRNLPLIEQREKVPSQLILPHPRIQDRAFVLVPLADVAADWSHPLLGRTVRAMLSDCDPEDVASVVPLI